MVAVGHHILGYDLFLFLLRVCYCDWRRTALQKTPCLVKLFDRWASVSHAHAGPKIVQKMIDVRCIGFSTQIENKKRDDMEHTLMVSDGSVK